MTRAILAMVFVIGAMPVPVRAQRAQTAVVPEAITVGDVFRAAIRVELDDALDVVAPDSLVLPPDVENAGRRELRVDTAGGMRRITFVYPLAAWRPGEYAVPPVVLQVVTAGAPRQLVAELPGFTVRSVLPADTAGIQPQPAKDVLGGNRVWWPLLLALLAAALVALALYAWWRRRRRGAIDAPLPLAPPVPPRDAALARLEELRRSGLLERGDVKRYYEVLTETLRRYAASVEPGWSADLTTSELAGRMRATGTLPLTDALELTRILGAGDLIKFAQFRPAADAPGHDLAAARAWVERVPAPASAQPPAGAEIDDRRVA